MVGYRCRLSVILSPPLGPQRVELSLRLDE